MQEKIGVKCECLVCKCAHPAAIMNKRNSKCTPIYSATSYGKESQPSSGAGVVDLFDAAAVKERR